MERYPTDAQIDSIVVISADEMEMIVRDVVDKWLHKLLAEIAPVEHKLLAEIAPVEHKLFAEIAPVEHKLFAEIAPVERIRQETETTETNQEEARTRFPGLPHDIALRPRPTAYTPMRMKKRHRRWRIKICTGNLQLLLPVAA